VKRKGEEQGAGAGRSETDGIEPTVAAGDHFTRIPPISPSKELANVKPARSHPTSSRSKEECQFAESPLRGSECHGREIRKTEFQKDQRRSVRSASVCTPVSKRTSRSAELFLIRLNIYLNYGLWTFLF